MKRGIITPKVAHAIELVEGGMTVYQAAKVAEVAESSVHRAIARNNDKCPTCGQFLPTVSGTNTPCQASKTKPKKQ